MNIDLNWVIPAIAIISMVVNVGVTMAVVTRLEASHNALVEHVQELRETVANIKGRMGVGVNGGGKA